MYGQGKCAWFRLPKDGRHLDRHATIYTMTLSCERLRVLEDGWWLVDGEICVT